MYSLDSLCAFILLVVAIITQHCLCTMVSMRGGEYIVRNIRLDKIHSEALHVVFRFKTIDPSSLLLFSANHQRGDYISLELIGGKLRYKGRLGDEEKGEQLMVVDGGSTSSSSNSLNDNQWHVVDLKIKKRSVTIELDYKATTKTFNGLYEVLDLDSDVFIGGIDPNLDVSKYGITVRRYSGCLHNFLFNDADYLYNTKFSKPSYSSYGDLLWNQCEKIDYQPIMFQSPQEHALLPTYLEHSMSLTFKFRTLIGVGLMFTKDSKAVTATLYLKGGQLFLSVRIGEGNGPIVLTKGANLDDGFWHRVEITINTKYVMLKLDEYSSLVHYSPFSHLVAFHKGNASLGGGEEHILKGFVGCMYNIWMDNTLVNYKKLSPVYSAGVLRKCDLQDHCLFSPCRNGGRCSQDNEKYECDCINTMYSGPTCQDSVFQRSCQEYMDLGLKEDSYCTIDPDGDQAKIEPFRVLCNVTRYPRTAVTVFEHKLPSGSGDIPVGKGVVEGGSYHHNVDYAIDLDTFDYLLKYATHCQQHVEFKCKNAPLMNSPRGPADTVWIGREGRDEQYWGGAEPDSGSCACSHDRSCADPYRYCNCDVGDDVWRSDAGYLNQTERLPVMMLSFRLTANQSFFSVGNLECQFNATAIPHNLSKFRALKACTSLNQKSTNRPVVTDPSIKQNERILSWEKPKFNHGGKGSTHNKNNGGFVGPYIPNVNVNVTVELPKIMNSAKENDGLKFTLSVYAVIVIAVATVIVVVIIAIVIIAKRCQGFRDGSGGSRRNRGSDMDDGYDRDDEGTNEMCTFFGSYQRGSNRGSSNRPVIEVHRHSIHCDTLDELPPAYREFSTYEYGHQPITTHIDLSYKPQRKTLGLFC